MKQVLLAKAVRYPFGSTVVHRSGETIEVEDADLDTLRDMGVLTDEKPAAPTAPVEKPAAKPEPKQAETPAPASGYPPLPAKTAPVAEWKEYARRNNIKLTGLTKRNEIMGFVTKTVNQSR